MKGGESTAAADSIAIAIAGLGMEKPRVTELQGGVANRSFRLRDGSRDYVLRLAGKATSGLGASRSSELAMQTIAAEAGLAPEIVLVDRARDFIVTRHVDGRVPPLAEFRKPGFLGRVGGWIARLHSLEAPSGLAAVDFGERAAAYLARLQARDERADVAGIARELERRRAGIPPPAGLAACHHDLHHRNFVDTGGGLIAVDWEYAGAGDAAADLACCIGYQELVGTEIETLLAGYGEDGAGLGGRVEALRWIFDCLWFGWNAAAVLDGLESDPELQDRLVARLTA